ncbi:hypothetical protein AB0E04_42000 [Streptomyces sp. NPDC048251]|uniref:hypothetical protein n=1 Tax=Streptomyces sp. NPDC048251 TaxID=3154501 RepID=UPI00343C6B2A
MNDTFTTRVEQGGGPVHTGPGDLHYTVHMNAGDKEAPGRSPRRIADDQLRLLRQQFVDPAGMGMARRVLEDSRTVILHGDPGSGRSAAACVLLYEVDQGTGIFRELLPGEEEGALTDPGLVGVGDRLLLNLAAADVSQWAQTRRDLSALRKAVQEQQGHLVVVMPHDGALEAHLQPYRADIGRPPALEVFRRHLRLHRIAYEEYRLSAPDLDEFLSEQPPMEEIAHFADRVRRARAASPGEGFAAWCKQSRKARIQWRTEVADLVATQCTAEQRALLFATAMLHGAHADVIHRGAALLLEALDTPRDEAPLLEGKDLAERLKEIHAAAGPDGRVRFDKLDYDAAVRAHFWDHMPDLRQPFSTWAVQSTELDDPHIDADLRERLVSRLADQFLRTGRGNDLAFLAEEWSAAPASRVRLAAAVDTLACGLHHARYGRSLRMIVYSWCVSKHLTENLAHVLRRACTDVIAPTHPDQAVTRLHHLARRERGATPALDALCQLVASSARLRRLLLDRLTRQSSAPAVDAGLFLRICDPVALTDPAGAPRPLIDEKGVRDCAVAGWAQALAQLPQSHWQPYAVRWLHTACSADGHRDRLLDLLVDAAGRDGSTLAALYSAARAAEPAAPDGRSSGAAITERLLQKISTAQGLRPPAGPTPSAPPRGTPR